MDAKVESNIKVTTCTKYAHQKYIATQEKKQEPS
jgi:hypothetical protein